MATAYYFAAHFNMPRPHTNETVLPTPLSMPTPLPSIHTTTTIKKTTTAPTYNVFASAAQRTRPGVTDSQTKSIFFRLPAELRNQIYEELLCSGTPSHKTLPTYTSSKKPEPVYPALLSTCRRINEEAKDLPYTTHIFHAHPSLLTSMPHLLSSAQPVINPEGVSKINRWQLTLRLDTDPRFTAEQAAAAFSGAEYLEIRVWQSMFDGCDSSVLRLFAGVRGVRVARVTGSADPEVARWLEGRMMMPVEKEGGCGCVEEMEIQCGECCGRMEVKRFGGRDVWTFANR